MSSNSKYIGPRQVHGQRNEYGIGTAVEGGLRKEEAERLAGNGTAVPASAAETGDPVGVWWAEPCCRGALVPHRTCQPAFCFLGFDLPPG